MCLASTEAGGPRRCSADARHAYASAAMAVACLERSVESAVAARPRLALSPSRAADFRRCPLLYRLRAIDRIPEPPAPAAVRGSVVHAALEELYRLPAAQRTPEVADGLLGTAWERVSAGSGAAAARWSGDQVQGVLDEARGMLARYFRLEDPRRFSPAAVEHRIELRLADGTPLRGFIDRVDVAPTGEVRIVDYKTGRSPSEGSAETRAWYQMKFYAVAIWRQRGVVPARLRLLFLGDGSVLDYSPDPDELARFERSLSALWRSIQSAGRSGDFPSRPSRFCGGCAHQVRCPSFGGTPPPFPHNPAD